MIFLELVKSKNHDLPYWTYPCFGLEKLSNDQWLAEFRFMRNDIYKVREDFNIPDQFVCYNGTSVSGIEGLCIYLFQAYIFAHHNWRLTTLNQPWLSPNFLEQYCQAIHDSGAPLQNCWGFVDGILVNICRPKEFQRLLFNEHKRVAVEQVFADIKNYFTFLDFKKKLKIGLSAVGKMYSACALLHNAYLYGNLTNRHFDIYPPQLRDYFQQEQKQQCI